MHNKAIKLMDFLRHFLAFASFILSQKTPQKSHSL